MKSFVAFALALFGSVSLAAQTATNQAAPLHAVPLTSPQTVTFYNSETQKTTTIVVNLPQLSSCPVSVRAQQSSAANRMEVDQSRPKGLAQLIHLTLANPAGSQVTRAKVTIRGLLPKTRATLTPALTSMTLGADPSDAAKTLDVAFSTTPETSSADKSATADLWVPALSAVYTIDLVSVTYADGSTWTANTAKTCRTPIDGMMLVGAR
jgi:hypothetical protein